MQKPNHPTKENRAKMIMKNMGQMIGDTKNMTDQKMKKMVMAGRMSSKQA